MILNRLRKLPRRTYILLLLPLILTASQGFCMFETLGNITSPDPSCSKFQITGVDGFPQGPINVAWTPIKNAQAYHVGVISSDPAFPLGVSEAPASATSTSVVLDQAILGQAAIAQATISIIATVDMGPGVFCMAISNYSFHFTKQKKVVPHIVPTATPQPQQSNPPPPPQPQQPPKKAPSCPPGTQGDPSKGIACSPILK